MISVFVVDDHKILLDAMVDFLNKTPQISCVGTASSGNEAINKFSINKPDIILMDIGLPDMNGLECAAAILKKEPEQKIIALSSYLELSVVKKMFKIGAKSYVSKSSDMEELILAINKIYAGETFVSQSIQAQFLNQLSGVEQKDGFDKPQITKRELEVLKLIAEEKTTTEISEQLFISVNTVESHRKNLISKFQVRNSVGLVKKALTLKIIQA